MHRLAALKQVFKPLRLSVPVRLAFSERKLLLRSGDLFLIATSIGLALLIWSAWSGRTLDWALLRWQVPWMGLMLFGWPLLLMLNDMYDLRVAARLGISARRILTGGVSITIVYLALFFITSRTPALSVYPAILTNLGSDAMLRLAPVMAIGIATGLLLLWRAVYVWALCGPQARSRLVILGAGRAGTALCEVILQQHRAHYHLLGFLDDDPAKQAQSINTIPVLGGHEQLAQLVEAQCLDEIAIAISTEVRGSLFQTVMDCHERGITITPMPLLYERLTGRVAVEHIGSQWYVALPLQPPAASPALRFIKRLIDLTFGILLGLVFVLVTPVIALAIRLDSPGPIFYRQERVGLHGRTFYVLKFRSMTEDAEQDGEAHWAVENDQRITRVGRILRRIRLDELPQVLNVIRGEMSLVGPRPERPQLVEQLQDQIPFYRTRLAAKPGLTGWAQINYGYGNSVEDALIKLQYDLYYLKHQSPWFDLLIILRTIGVVVRMKGL